MESAAVEGSCFFSPEVVSGDAQLARALREQAVQITRLAIVRIQQIVRFKKACGSCI